jgi:oxygen-independent coproporphyrinogen-3 oxidase
MLKPELLAQLHKAVPRYTSYPTAVEWIPLTAEAYLTKLSSMKEELSLYIHIPFCERMCLYCGCAVILNRKAENEIRYVDTLIQEIDLVTHSLQHKATITQLHFGGGTPTKLSEDLLIKLMEKLESAFEIDFSQEVAIEIDPRTVSEDRGRKLRLLKQLGFNRVSFGVQDTDDIVQEAVKRRQSWQMTKETFLLAKELGFSNINIDLIYGLPFQTRHSFQNTISQIIELKPDRIALFSYAKVPWLKPHQKAIKEETLPSFEEKFFIYAQAREQLLQNGYVAIGMDHFALEKDALAIAYKHKKLTRNFQGYSVQAAPEMIGLGLTAVGFVQGGYFQNHKHLADYTHSISRGILPTHRGFVLSEEDLLRKKLIHSLMCHFELEKQGEFLPCFSGLHTELLQLETLGLVRNTPDMLYVTALGELFVRNIAVLFDSYSSQRNGSTTFSKSI